MQDTPALPLATLMRVPVPTPCTMRTEPTKIQHDVIALDENGAVLHRWAWWAHGKPRRVKARTAVINGVRYRVQYA